MKLQLRLHPNGILRQKCKAISEVNQRHRKLAASMHTHMKKWNGIGLSAPQVGRDISIIVINTMTEDLNGKRLTMYNPEILSEYNPVLMKEGCLSFPNEYYDIERASKVVVKYIDGSNTEHIETFEGLTARAIIHEIDHLHGKLMVDYIGENNG